MLCYDVLHWCYVTVLCTDVMLWCYALMLHRYSLSVHTFRDGVTLQHYITCLYLKIEYNCISFCSCSKTNLQKLELHQNLGLRISVCTFCSIPIITLCVETCTHLFHTPYKNCLFNSSLKQLLSPHSLVYLPTTISSTLALCFQPLYPLLWLQRTWHPIPLLTFIITLPLFQ